PFQTRRDLDHRQGANLSRRELYGEWNSCNCWQIRVTARTFAGVKIQLDSAAPARSANKHRRVLAKLVQGLRSNFSRTRQGQHAQDCFPTDAERFTASSQHEMLGHVRTMSWTSSARSCT